MSTKNKQISIDMIIYYVIRNCLRWSRRTRFIAQFFIFLLLFSLFFIRFFFSIVSLKLSLHYSRLYLHVCARPKVLQIEINKWYIMSKIIEKVRSKNLKYGVGNFPNDFEFNIHILIWHSQPNKISWILSNCQSSFGPC